MCLFLFFPHNLTHAFIKLGYSRTAPALSSQLCSKQLVQFGVPLEISHTALQCNANVNFDTNHSVTPEV